MPAIAKTASVLRRFQIVPWTVLALSGALTAAATLIGV